MEPIVNAALTLLALYAAAGLIFAIAFVTKGVETVDEGAQGATWGFRIIIIPGTVVFWPILLKKLIRKRKEV